MEFRHFETEENVDLPLQTESEKIYEQLHVFGQLRVSFCVSSIVMGGYCINPKLMGGYGWLLVVTGDYWEVMGDSRF